MLERLLALVRAGGTYHIGDLATTLDTSPELVAAMIENLQRLGYLKTVDNTCKDGCNGCPLVSSCSKPANGKLWTLEN